MEIINLDKSELFAAISAPNGIIDANALTSFIRRVGKNLQVNGEIPNFNIKFEENRVVVALSQMI